MPERWRRSRGYMDSSFPLLMFAGITIIVLIPWLIEHANTGQFTGIRLYAGAAVIGGISLALQALAIHFFLAEAYHDAYSGGVRSGLNQAPVFSGMGGPFMLAVLYGVGIWRLAGLEQDATWGIAAYALIAVAVSAGAVIARARGSRVGTRSSNG